LWVYGCPLSDLPTGELESNGYWTTCQPKPCDIIFLTGNLPTVKSLKIRAFFGGSSAKSQVVSISGKRVVGDNVLFLPVGELKPSGETPGWEEFTLDVANRDLLVISQEQNQNFVQNRFQNCETIFNSRH
jgi:hypothetical protein